jgi:hypothetical protein
MNKIGLWLVKSETIGSAVSSVTVSDAFSTDYDAYKIVVTDGVSSANTRLGITLGATATGYYWGLTTSRYDNLGNASIGGGNAALWDYVGMASTTGLSATIEILNPFLAKRTTYTSLWTDSQTGGGNSAGPSSGMLNNTTSYTSFVLAPSTGTLTGGSINVYGYRKA